MPEKIVITLEIEKRSLSGLTRLITRIKKLIKSGAKNGIVEDSKSCNQAIYHTTGGGYHAR